MTRLEASALNAMLLDVPDWRLEEEGDRILRTLKFRDFSEAFSFMARVALLAERMDHHPDWSNIYNRVEIALTTHDAGGVTKNDIEMAKTIDGYVD